MSNNIKHLPQYQVRGEQADLVVCGTEDKAAKIIDVE